MEMTLQHETDLLTTGDGLKLFTQCWLPAESRAVVIISHGYAEHSSRYEHVAAALVAAGFAVYALEHRGHGRSEGERANVEVFREYVTDLCRFIEQVRVKHTDVPRFLLGHSVGAVIALQLVLEHPHKVDGLIISGAYLRNAVSTSPLLLLLSEQLSRFFPSLPLQAPDKNALSRDPEVVRAYGADPLVYNGKAKARVGTEMLRAGPYVLGRAQDIKLPILIMHGAEDGIAAVSGSRELFEAVGSEDKTLEVYEGLYHEIFNEPEQEQVIGDMLRWLERHINP